MIGTEAIVNRRSINDRIAVGLRLALRRSLSRTPVMFSVRAIEKNAIAAVISSLGSAKRRIWPANPGRCQAGSIGKTLEPRVISP
jgi:hypothetical protein